MLVHLPLSDSTNGKVFQFLDGNTAVFSCNDAYTKKENSFLHCIAKWKLEFYSSNMHKIILIS